MGVMWRDCRAFRLPFFIEAEELVVSFPFFGRWKRDLGELGISLCVKERKTIKSERCRYCWE